MRYCIVLFVVLACIFVLILIASYSSLSKTNENPILSESVARDTYKSNDKNVHNINTSDDSGDQNVRNIVQAFDVALKEIDKIYSIKNRRYQVTITEMQNSEGWSFLLWILPAVPEGDITATVKRNGEVKITSGFSRVKE
jgi:hypothetical protein